jgi:phage FluMu protein Com
MINFKCSKCGEPLEAPESMAHDSIKCPKCSQSNLITPKTQKHINKYFYIVGYLVRRILRVLRYVLGLFLGVILILLGIMTLADATNPYSNMGICESPARDNNIVILVGLTLFIAGCLFIILPGIARRLDKILDKLDKSP